MILFIKNIFLVVLAFQLLCTPSAQAQEQLINENAAKAAFVYNVALYVSWPPPQSDTILVGILGKGPLEPEWKNLTGKALNNRKVKVFKSNDIEELLECQIVFIEESSPKKLSRILSQLKNYPILTIGDSPAFSNLGGMLHVSVKNNRITFVANQIQARSSGLEISSKLLKLATEVIK